MQNIAKKYLFKSLQLSTMCYIFVGMKMELNNLMSIKNYADKENVTASYIYKLIKEGKMFPVFVDDVQFIDTKKFPVIPVANRR